MDITDNTSATHLYRIAQEALNNALRHGHADEIYISLVQQNDRIILAVSDNGVGFDRGASRTEKTGGMGLRTMEYRAGLIGGTLHVERSEKGGTLVRCDVPLGVA